MAFTDWDITGTTSAVENSTISNPLPTGSFGSYCRSISGSASMLIKSSYQSGAFVGIPSTKVIRVRGAIRKWFNTNQYSGGLVVKWNNTTNRGYSVCYDASPQALCLKLDNGANYVLPAAGGINSDWYSIQMEVYPIGTTSDRIIVSQETSLGSGIYNPLSINGGVAAEGIVIPSTDPRYAVWGGTSRCGVVSELDLNYTQGGIYVDKVLFQISNVP